MLKVCVMISFQFAPSEDLSVVSLTASEWKLCESAVW